ncbi:SDR family oxidoreductase [Sphingomonas sp.]|uniref:SDR family oxidoreductase n=1 Tax=Sphingomonas sp. TaxID=28214 RepID=UPI003B000694
MGGRQDLRIVITGASSGIGAATAIAFARNGGRLMLAARGADGLDDVAARCRAAGGEAHVHVADIVEPGASAALAEAAQAALGGIDLWFSNVGVGVVGRFHEVPADVHARVVVANLVGHMNDAHAVVPIFLGQGHGTWVNMISVGGFVATPHAAAYSASKFGLRGFSQALRGELSKHPQIHVCDVYPTFVDTPGVDHAGNWSGKRLSLPPGALAPETVAKAVARLTRRPRDTTVVGAPAPALVLAQALTPNLGAAVMNGFMDVWEKHGERAGDTPGTLFDPPGASGIDGGRRDPAKRRVGVAIASVAALALAGVALGRARR